MAQTRLKKTSRGGFVVAAAAVATTIVLLPFALVSLIGNLKSPSGLRAYQIIGTAPHKAAVVTDQLSINIDAVTLSELQHSVSLRVSGVQRCTANCGEVRRLRLYSMGANPALAQGIPPSVYLDIPGDETQINQDVSLPIEGSLASYPFDSYSLYLGASVARLDTAHKEIPLSRAVQDANLALSFGEEIPRVDMGPPRPTAAIGLAPPDPYGFTTYVKFGRPLYLQIFDLLVIILTALAATYAVLLRPFDQIITNAGVLVLGMWGVRSLLVGSYSADSTAVDLALIVIVVFLLLTIAARGLTVLWHRSWGDPPEGDGNDGAHASAGVLTSAAHAQDPSHGSALHH